MSIPKITVDEAVDLIEGRGARYLDIRSVMEYDLGHPPGAMNIPMLDYDPAIGYMLPNPRFLEVVQLLFPIDTVLVVAGNSGTRSPDAVKMLAQVGYTAIYEMVGGYGGMRDHTGSFVHEGWVHSSHPKTTGQDSGSYAAILHRLQGAS